MAFLVLHQMLRIIIRYEEGVIMVAWKIKVILCCCFILNPLLVTNCWGQPLAKDPCGTPQGPLGLSLQTPFTLGACIGQYNY